MVCYAPIWRNGFVWDDDTMLTRNPFVKAPAGLHYIWFSTRLPDYFPLTSTSLWVEWRLWGMNATGYHVTSLVLHVLSALLVWRVLRRLRIPGAWWAALIFAVHPVNVESVAWIAERKNTLAMLFFLLSLLCYLRGGSKWFWGALLAFLCSLLSKPSAALAPVVLLLCAWWQTGRITRRDLWRSVPFFALSFALGLVTMWFQHHRAIGSDVAEMRELGARVAGAGWAVWFYLFKALVPLNLCFVYPHWEVNAHAVLSYVPGLALVLLGGAAWHSRRGWGRPVLFALAYFILMLLPVLGFVDIYFHRYSLVADHWQYFAIISPIALVVGGGSSLLGSPGLKSVRLAAGAAAVAVVAALGCLSWHQVKAYADAQTLWHDTLAKNPASWMPHNNLGLLYANQGNYQEAMKEYDTALRIHPNPMGDNNFGSILMEQGRLEEAEAHFRSALRVNPLFPMAYYNLGNLADARGNLAEAVACYQRALELQPRYPEARNNLALVLARQGIFAEAQEQLRQALQERPDYADACNNLASLLIEQGKPAEAASWLAQCLELNPDCAAAFYNLGNAQAKMGKTAEAVKDYQRALALKPGLAEPHYKLGNICLKQGNKAEARDHYLAALERRPEFAEVHYQLGMLLTSQKQWQEGVPHLREAVRLKPDWREALNNLAWIYATQPDAQWRNGPEAERLATHALAVSPTNDPGALDTLAAAQAEAGHFPQAVQTAEHAIQSAQAAGQPQLARRMEQRLDLYRQQQAYRE
jgi:protein O-mannosyl-transferase